jgi:hypothetical protein
MCEALLLARTELPFTDGGTGSLWRFAIGHVIAVQPDGFPWGGLEDPRNFATAAQRRFALLRFPGVGVARVQRYLAAQQDPTPPNDPTQSRLPLRGRLWQIQWQSLPAAARSILVSTGVLTIGPAAQGGDFTWAQVQNFVTRQDTGAFDADPLT